MSRLSQPRSRIERQGADRARWLRSRMAKDVRQAREDAGISQRRLAAVAGISPSTVQSLERARFDPSTEVLARLATALGMSLNMRLYPGTGPLVRDHLQAAMITALLDIIHDLWQPRPEVAVSEPVRGVIDLVLEAAALPGGPVIITCEAHSELRRLEQQLRWATAKSMALSEVRAQPTSRLLLLRSTRRTRNVIAQYESLVRAAYPARISDAYAALVDGALWPGHALLWCRVRGATAEVMDRAPRGISLGR